MKKIKKISLISIFCLALVFSLNLALRHFFLQNIQFFFSIKDVYLFNFFLSLIVVLTVAFIYSKFPDKAGYTFLGFSIVKIVFSVIYLYPLIESNLENKIPDVLNFFFCYFIFLLVESVIVVTLLKEEK